MRSYFRFVVTLAVVDSLCIFFFVAAVIILLLFRFFLFYLFLFFCFFFFFQAEDGIRDADVTGVQTCALPILVTDGFGNKKIAEQLFISEKTVKTHVANILGKLQVKSRTQAALYATKMGWFRSEEHTSELQSRPHLVCRLLLEKNNRQYLSNAI